LAGSTISSEEEHVPRRQRPRPSDDPALERAREREQEVEPERERALTREVVEFEPGQEGTVGSGTAESGTLPGSVGGTTGNTYRAAGAQSPGASAPPIPGIDPGRARGLVGRFRRGKDLEEGGGGGAGSEESRLEEGEESAGEGPGHDKGE
jgi:hypothetical protein